MADDTRVVEDVLSDLRGAAEDGEETSVGDVVEAIGHRGYGPFLMLPPLLALTPLGGVPGVPSLFALLTGLFAGQIAFGQSHLWLPRILRERSVQSKKVRKAVEKLKPIGRTLDRWFQRRLTSLVSDTGIRVAASFALALCILVPPLEILPFVAVAPLAAISVFGLAILFRDGVLMLAGYAIAVLALGVAFGLIVL